MRQFDYITIASAASDPATAAALARIDRVRDLGAFRSGYTKRELDQLRLRALADDGRTSCALSGIIVPAARIRGLVAGDFAPESEPEHEVVGYLRTLNTVEYQYRSTHLSPGVIMLLHKRMFFDVNRRVAGRWRTREDDASWNAAHPVSEHASSPDFLGLEVPPAEEIEPLLHAVCAAYRAAARAPKAAHPVVQAAAVLCDVENIHPFAVGSGRMARILFQLVLLKNDCLIGLYQSLCQAIHRTRGEFRDALRKSSAGWARGENDYGPLVSYLADIVDSCYETHGEYERAKESEASAARPTAHAPRTANADASASYSGRAAHPTHEQAHRTMGSGTTAGAYRPARAGAPTQTASHAQTAAERIEALAEERIAAMRAAKKRAAAEAAEAAERAQTETAPAPQDRSAAASSAPVPAKPARPRPAKPAARTTAGEPTNEQIIRAYFATLDGEASKKEILDANPVMSKKTLERILKILREDGTVVMVGAARASRYRRA